MNDQTPKPKPARKPRAKKAKPVSNCPDPFVRNEFGVIPPQTGVSSFAKAAAPNTDSSDTAPFPANSQPGNQDTSGSKEGVGTTPQLAATDRQQNVGDVPPSVAESGSTYGLAAENLPRETQAAATRRWRATGIAEQVAVFRDRKREEYSRANPKCKRRDAHEYAWECAMAKFPPPGTEPLIVEELQAEPEPPEQIEAVEEPISEVAPPYPPADMGVSGLGDLPADWPKLPANALLQVEIAWVSANRLRVRSGSGVDLSRALSPAPSYSALSWLETSILFPSKFADISVKATAQQDDELEGIRREKLAIEEIRGLLAEMLEG